jgi:hypothetical protein
LIWSSDEYLVCPGSAPWLGHSCASADSRKTDSKRAPVRVTRKTFFMGMNVYQIREKKRKRRGRGQGSGGEGERWGDEVPALAEGVSKQPENLVPIEQAASRMEARCV